MPQEQPTTQETIEKRLRTEVNGTERKGALRRHLGTSGSLQARPELDYGRDPRRAVSDQRITLSSCPRPREWDQPRRTGRAVHASGFLCWMAERDDGSQYSHGGLRPNGIGLSSVVRDVKS